MKYKWKMKCRKFTQKFRSYWEKPPRNKSKKKTSVAKLSVPEVVETSFQSNYATVQTNKWSKNFSGNYVASFVNENNLQQTTEYNSNGVLLKTKTIFDVAAPFKT